MDKIRWTKPALQDLDDIGAYIALYNPRAAEKTVRRIVEAAAALGFFPHIGRQGRIIGTRELIVGDTPLMPGGRVSNLPLRIRPAASVNCAKMWETQAQHTA
ncbi:MAG: type II toxin-antitoxin system RelE/ParE family toxin [Rhodospirillales bacterium]|nr:type II toxin-antitoxin system RelE/ParE family toxin [Rhodospirillales bacterium]